MDGSNQAPVDIENGRGNTYIQLASSIRDELKSLPPLSSDCCIYRVPQQLRCVNEKAYTPQVVSIGPLHHGKEGLKAMEKHKKRYLRNFLSRTNVGLEEYIEKIKEQETRLRNCYAVEDIEYSSDQFVRIILVDAAFIVQLLMRCARVGFNESENHEEDRIFNKPWMVHSIAPDLQLLENQLPFFILQDLIDTYKSTLSSDRNMTAETGGQFSISYLSYNFFNVTMGLVVAQDHLEKILSPSSCRAKHFVDLLRRLQGPLNLVEDPQTRGRPVITEITPDITKLHQSGVKFKLGSTKNLFDIRFTHGILEIPKLIIHDYTELTLRNLIAFEQCHCEKQHYISNYVAILDDFVNTPRDVELLVKDGIIENLLGDNNEASTLINNLGKGVSVNIGQDIHYARLCEQLNKYCRKPWNKWKAILRQNYFNTPWATISVGGAVFLIILTLIQTVFSILAGMPTKHQKAFSP